jgi:hypothetical protein
MRWQGTYHIASDVSAKNCALGSYLFIVGKIYQYGHPSQSLAVLFGKLKSLTENFLNFLPVIFAKATAISSDDSSPTSGKTAFPQTLILGLYLLQS